MIAAARCALALGCVIANVVFGEFETRASDRSAYAVFHTREQAAGISFANLKTEARNSCAPRWGFIGQTSDKEERVWGGIADKYRGVKSIRGDRSFSERIEFDWWARKEGDANSSVFQQGKICSPLPFLRSLNFGFVVQDGYVTENHLQGRREPVVSVGNFDIDSDVTGCDCEAAVRIGGEFDGDPRSLFGGKEALGELGLFLTGVPELISRSFQRPSEASNSDRSQGRNSDAMVVRALLICQRMTRITL